MTRRLLLTLVVLIAVTGCGVRPSGVITGGPAPTGRAIGGFDVPLLPGRPEGAVLYFLDGPAPTPVFRPARRHLSPTQTLALLQSGLDADERAANLRSEVPAGLDPVSVTIAAAGDVDVVVSADVSALSAAAVDQIVCTVGEALSTTAPVTLTSAAATRGPRACPATG